MPEGIREKNWQHWLILSSGQKRINETIRRRAVYALLVTGNSPSSSRVGALIRGRSRLVDEVTIHSLVKWCNRVACHDFLQQRHF